jgi:hypothetical protein
MPFGQLLIEFEGDEQQLTKAGNIMRELNVHYEIVH